MELNNFSLSPEELASFISFITLQTGIIPRESHRSGIKSFIEKTLSERASTVAEYRKQLAINPTLLTELINASTVNETYFFREEKQFQFLKDSIFPQWRLLNPHTPLRVWSAACSYGEEAYSIALLAQHCNVDVQITASDINSEVLEHCKNGVFLDGSIRQVDGVSFKNLVLPYQREDRKVAFSQEIKNSIQTRKINLAQIDLPTTEVFLPKNQDIVFLRNVFIYFSPELRAKILRTIAEKCLAENGILFVSMSEIAQLDSTLIPPSLEKVMDGSVFYFHKKSSKTGDVNGKNF